MRKKSHLQYRRNEIIATFEDKIIAKAIGMNDIRLNIICSNTHSPLTNVLYIIIAKRPHCIVYMSTLAVKNHVFVVFSTICITDPADLKFHHTKLTILRIEPDTLAVNVAVVPWNFSFWKFPMSFRHFLKFKRFVLRKNISFNMERKRFLNSKHLIWCARVCASVCLRLSMYRIALFVLYTWMAQRYTFFMAIWQMNKRRYVFIVVRDSKNKYQFIGELFVFTESMCGCVYAYIHSHARAYTTIHIRSTTKHLLSCSHSVARSLCVCDAFITPIQLNHI